MFQHLDGNKDSLDVKIVAIAQDYEPKLISFDDDAEEELGDRYSNGDNVIPDWDPTPPAAGFILAAKFDSEEGPIAWFVRPIAPDNPGSSRERRLKRLEVATHLIEREHTSDLAGHIPT